MLGKMSLKNLTVFQKADLEFAHGLNVIVGENGTGKTHLLKIAYVVLAVSADQARKAMDASPPSSKRALEVRLSEKLINVFRPEQLGHLVHHNGEGSQKCDVSLGFELDEMGIDFGFDATTESELIITKAPTTWSRFTPVYFPTRELLTIYPNFVAVYENYHLNFDETWRDTCVLLGGLIQKSATQEAAELLKPFEKALGGEIELHKNGSFYLRTKTGQMEMPLVAEGLRKLGMLARLIATGTLLNKGYLFWDEPEANLNPTLIRQVARSITALCETGVQVFIATHSLFLLRELEILLNDEFRTLDSRFMGLHRRKQGVVVQQGKTADEIGDIAALDEALRQSDRFLEAG